MLLPDLGHLSPGRMLNTLSSEELQRLKLISGLAEAIGSNMLILMENLREGCTRGILKNCCYFSMN